MAASGSIGTPWFEIKIHKQWQLRMLLQSCEGFEALAHAKKLYKHRHVLMPGHLFMELLNTKQDKLKALGFPDLVYENLQEVLLDVPGFLCTFWEVLKLKPKPCKASWSPDESKTRERLMHPKRVSTNWKHADGVKKTLATLRHPMLRYPLFRVRQSSFGKEVSSVHNWFGGQVLFPINKFLQCLPHLPLSSRFRERLVGNWEAVEWVQETTPAPTKSQKKAERILQQRAARSKNQTSLDYGLKETEGPKRTELGLGELKNRDQGPVSPNGALPGTSVPCTNASYVWNRSFLDPAAGEAVLPSRGLEKFFEHSSSQLMTYAHTRNLCRTMLSNCDYTYFHEWSADGEMCCSPGYLAGCENPTLRECCAALTVECLTLPHLEVKCAYIHSPSKQLEAEARTQLLGLVQEKEEDEDEAMEDVSEGEGGDSGNDEEDVDPDGNNEEGSGPDSSEDDPNPEQSDEDEDYEGDSSEREQTPGLEVLTGSPAQQLGFLMPALEALKKDEDLSGTSTPTFAAPVKTLEALQQAAATLEPGDVNEVIAIGALGPVFKIRLHSGEICAMKTAVPDTIEELGLQDEFKAYQKAQSLQGHFIPSLLAYGSAFSNNLTILATEYIQGAKFDANLHSRAKDAAIKALSLFHQTGMKHGDISDENIRITSRSKHVWLLDLHKATQGISPLQCQEEIAEMESLFT